MKFDTRSCWAWIKSAILMGMVPALAPGSGVAAPPGWVDLSGCGVGGYRASVAVPVPRIDVHLAVEGFDHTEQGDDMYKVKITGVDIKDLKTSDWRDDSGRGTPTFVSVSSSHARKRTEVARIPWPRVMFPSGGDSAYNHEGGCEEFRGDVRQVAQQMVGLEYLVSESDLTAGIYALSAVVYSPYQLTNLYWSAGDAPLPIPAAKGCIITGDARADVSAGSANLATVISCDSAGVVDVSLLDSTGRQVSTGVLTDGSGSVRVLPSGANRWPAHFSVLEHSRHPLEMTATPGEGTPPGYYTYRGTLRVAAP